MGLLDGPSDAPDITIVPIDAGTNQRIDNSADDAMRSTSTLAAKRNEGLDQAGLISSQNKFNQNENSLGMGEGLTGDAIRNKYKVQLGNEIMQLKRTNTRDSELQRADDLSRVQGVLQARQNVQNESYKRLMTAYKNKQAARANFISSIFGLVGMVGGAVAGGPAGAVKGNEVASRISPQRRMSSISDEGDEYG